MENISQQNEISLILDLMQVVKDEPTDSWEINFAFGEMQFPLGMKKKYAKAKREWKKKR